MVPTGYILMNLAILLLLAFSRSCRVKATGLLSWCMNALNANILNPLLNFHWLWSLCCCGHEHWKLTSWVTFFAISFIWCHSPSATSIKPVNTLWNLTWSSLKAISHRNPNSPKVTYPHPTPISQTDFQPRNPKVVPLLISFSAEEFKQITSICVWRSPLGKGPRRIYCCRNTNIDFIKHCEQRALMLSICPPGPGSRLLTEQQRLIGEILYPVMLHDVCDEEVCGGRPYSLLSPMR